MTNRKADGTVICLFCLKRMKEMSKRKKLLPWFTLIMFTLFFMMLINFNLCAYLLNQDAYEDVNCRVTDKTYDGLLAFFPKIEVTYTYKGKEINSEKVVYNGIFFNDNVDNATLFVNKSNPDYFLVIQPFLSGWLNWVLVFNLIVVTSIFIYNLEENIRRYVKVKQERKQRRNREKGR